MATEGMFEKLKMLSGPSCWGSRSGWFAGVSLTGELLLATDTMDSARRENVPPPPTQTCGPTHLGPPDPGQEDLGLSIQEDPGLSVQTRF